MIGPCCEGLHIIIQDFVFHIYIKKLHAICKIMSMESAYIIQHVVEVLTEVLVPMFVHVLHFDFFGDSNFSLCSYRLYEFSSNQKNCSTNPFHCDFLNLWDL